MNIATTGFKTWRMREQEARQEAAFFLACGIDLGAALRSKGGERDLMVRRLERLIERERLKGWRRHWSYDLNRHIALKQALDRIRRSLPSPPVEGGLARSAKTDEG